jgi:hypothetical protein
LITFGWAACAASRFDSVRLIAAKCVAQLTKIA